MVVSASKLNVSENSVKSSESAEIEAAATVAQDSVPEPSVLSKVLAAPSVLGSVQVTLLAIVAAP